MREDKQNTINKIIIKHEKQEVKRNIIIRGLNIEGKICKEKIEKSITEDC